MADFVGTIHDPSIARLTPDSAVGRVYRPSTAAVGEAADVIPPVTTVVSPAGSVIGGSQELVVDVTDAGGFAGIILAVEYTSGGYDVVHDGTNFSALFSTSARAVISGGFRYTLRRVGGWSEAFTLRSFPFDMGGNVG
jgi:hypothetical protein